MSNFSNTALTTVGDGPHYGDMYNNTWTSSHNSSGSEPHQDFNAHRVIVHVLLSCACIIGLAGNGAVTYLLGFRIKRSPFTTYILNLAVADFGVLLFGSLYHIFAFFFYSIVHVIFWESFKCMYAASQLLLTAISIDRCVCVLFPIWHRCHRPPHLPTTVCALIWVLSCVLIGSLATFYYLGFVLPWFFSYSFIACAVLCLPLVTVSTLILFFRVFCKPQQPRRGRLLTIVLLTLLFFLIFAFPLNVILAINSSRNSKLFSLETYCFLCSCLNSCVNPVIYFVVGRKMRGPQRQSLKVVLQRAFQEEEEQRVGCSTPAQMSP